MAVLKSIIIAFVTLVAYSSLVSADATPKGTKNDTQSAVATFTQGVTGIITFQGYYDNTTKKTSTVIKVDIHSGLNNHTGVYPYHIHVNPITNGNCTTAGGHLDPKNVTDAYTCAPPNLVACQLGDLSGKYGKLIPDSEGKNKTSEVDEFLSWTDEAYSMLGRSVVIHFPNGKLFLLYR
ncbi:9003_t:CDS:2 [Ambispora leptoticha]|uniref:9003_t:CDS:1 n=1 Tax=Ambispora leptoticha TaxID=144679 RepID=A0A9N9D0X3_9GLOM|nr:9003_t:CDS:2 [Ambispora leptoticha]